MEERQEKQEEELSVNDAAKEEEREVTEAQEASEDAVNTGAADEAADPDDANENPESDETDGTTAAEDDAKPEEADDTGEAESSEDGKSGKDKKERLSFKSRKEKKELAKKDEQIAELTDRVRRTMAEFDNYRKRTEKEKAKMYGMGVRDVIEKLLPVIDNFERGIAQIPKEEKEKPVAAGFEAIYKQFTGLLEQLGITPIEAVGKEFDPNLHNAVMHVDDEDAGENVVVEEFQKGYLYKEQVVRHSMVKVAN